MPEPVGAELAAAPSARRLLLIDGHSMAFRAFYALPDTMTTSSGQVTNAVYGFWSMLSRLIENEQPTHVIVAFDAGRESFRNDVYPEYKATRGTTPEAFVGQVPLIKEVLQATNIPSVELPGYEADDIIATLAAQAERAGMEVLICSGDRDTLQLVTDRVTLLYPVRGVSELARMTPEAVVAKYGVAPENYPDIAALVGETSDNLPGVPGVGPKTAQKWLAQFGGLEPLLDQAGTLTTKAGKTLAENVALVRRNRELNALLRDVKLPLGPGDATLVAFDREAVFRIADALQIGSLRDRILAVDPGQQAQVEPAARELDIIDVKPGELATVLASLPGPTAVVVVGSSRPGSGDAWAVALSDGQRAVSLSLPDLSPADEQALADFLANRAAPKILHNVKGAAHALRGRGMDLTGVVFDTELAAYLCYPDRRGNDLSDLVSRHLGRELQPVGAGGQGELDLATTPGADAARQAGALWELAEVLGGQLADRESADLLTDVELPLSRVLVDMEDVGIAVDEDYLAELEQSFADQSEAAAQAAYAAIGHEVNLASPKQLQEVLFTELNMPKTKKTKTGYTTDAAALVELSAKTDHPFLTHLLEHRDVTKLRTTVAGLRKAVAPDGRIHTTFQQTIAATGRLSSTEPNLQNIPIRTDAGRDIRRAFRPGDGYTSLLTADYSQIEMRIMAHLSQDQGLIDAFNSGEDLHRFVGARVFGVEPQDVDAEMRSKVKAMSYGLAYGLSAFGLSGQLGISPGAAQELMDDYFERFGGVQTYLAGVVEEARSTGWTATLLGRRRYLPDLNSDNRQRRAMAERMALNAPIQGSAADLMKLAMLGVDDEFRRQELRSRVLLQVHDELVVEVAPDEEDAVEAVLRSEMGQAFPLAVPLEVSIGRGQSWYDAGH